METEIKKKQSSEIKIDKKSKILFAILGILIAGSVAVTFWRYIINKDYIIQAQIDCDPETENCFVWECDPMSLEEGEACTGVPDNDIWYYKILKRNAKNIPDCDPNDENCLAYVCDEGEADCSEELCTLENIPEGETCNDPEQYLLENPPEEEECAEDDEECLVEEKSAGCEENDEECLMEEEGTECDAESEDCEESAAEPVQNENEELEGSSLQENSKQDVPSVGIEPM